MGWSYQHKPSSQSAEEFLIDNFSYTTDSGREVKVIDCVIVKDAYEDVAYMAVDRGDGRVTGLVCLIGEQVDYYNFGYKDIPESAGPAASYCPARILALLTPTDNDWANEWRAMCRKNLLRIN